MEILILICLIIVILLLVSDKFLIKKKAKSQALDNNKVVSNNENNIMGSIRDVEKSVIEPLVEINDFELESEQADVDEMLSNEEQKIDYNTEEEEWNEEREPNGDNGFATGVNFEELTNLGLLLKQDEIEPLSKNEAVETLNKIQGTELYELMIQSIENSSQKIAYLLDQHFALDNEISKIDSKNESKDFDITNFL